MQMREVKPVAAYRLSERLNVYRNTQCGWIAGVCAGIGDRLGIKAIWVRIAFLAIGPILHDHWIGIILYVALAFLLQPRAGVAAAASPAGVQRAYREFADTVGSTFTPPPTRASDLKSRFAAMDDRLNNLEAAAMSDEISLRRQFRDLGG